MALADVVPVPSGVKPSLSRDGQEHQIAPKIAVTGQPVGDARAGGEGASAVELPPSRVSSDPMLRADSARHPRTTSPDAFCRTVPAHQQVWKCAAAVQ